jgi:hypothetical protein
MNAEEETKLKNKTIEHYEKESSIYHSSPRLWDDGVILP